MGRFGSLLEEVMFCEGFLPVDTQTADNNGDWVSLEHYGRCLVVFYKNTGTASDDPTLTINQASSNTGTGSKALNFTVIYRKQAATNTQSTGTWTRTTQTAANTYTNGTSAEQALFWVVDIDARDLDVANNFKFIQGAVADTGSAGAQVGCLFYALYQPRYNLAPASMISALS